MGQECTNLTQLGIQPSRSLEAKPQISEAQSGQQEAIITPPHSPHVVVQKQGVTSPWAQSTTRPPGSPPPLSSPLLQFEMPLPPSQQLAGRTALHLQNWAKITDSQWVLDAVAGYKLELEEIPYQSHHPVTRAQKEPKRAYSPRGANPSGQESYRPDPSSSRERRVLLNTVLSAKERGPTQASDQPSSAEQVCESRAFQNGGDAHRAGPSAGGRLDDTTRFEGCILRNSYTQAPPEVSLIQMEEPELSIPVSPIRPVHSSTDVHQGVTSSDRIAETNGHQVHDLPRRHPHHEPGQGTGSPANLESHRLIGVSRLSDQLWQVGPRPRARDCVSGISAEFSSKRGAATATEAVADTTGSMPASLSESGICESTSKLHKQAISGHTCHISSSSSLPQPPATETQSTPSIRLRRLDESFTPSAGGFGVVDQQSGELEWKSHSTHSTRNGNRDGCLQEGLGSVLQRRFHRRMLVPGGENSSHQCPGIDGSNLWSAGLLQGQEGNFSAVEVRQCYGRGICQQNGRDSIPFVDTVGEGAVAMVSSSTHPSQSTAPTWETQLHSRFSVTPLAGQIRLDLRPGVICHDQQLIGSLGDRPLCNKILYSPSALCQLASGSNGRGDGCFSARLEYFHRVCTPTLVPCLSGPVQGSSTSCNIGDSCSTMENSSLVPSTASNAYRHSHPASSAARDIGAVSQLRLPHNEQSTSTNRLQGLRMCFEAEGIPEEAIDLILASWRTKTEANYDSAWRKWQNWCSSKNTNPFAADLSIVLGFLAKEFRDGKQYRSLNCYRSAISSAHLPIEGFPVGKHPLVCRLLKGVYNLPPPFPRYDCTWEVTKVTSLLQALGDNKQMTLKDLTQKLAMLLALVLAHRSSGLARLTLQGRKFTPEGVVLATKGVAKHTRPGREESLQPVTIPAFQEDKSLCPVECLKAYITATSQFRATEKSQQVFLSYQAPHKPVQSCTIARWIKQILKASGLNTEVFSAHSTRGAASTAAAMAGMSVQQIMARAGWSSMDTFCQHYYRPPAEATNAVNFGQAVLRDATNMQRTC